MLKSTPDPLPTIMTVTDEPPAVTPSVEPPATRPAAEPVTGIFTGPTAPAGTDGGTTQGESPARRLHRQRMKDFFARTYPTI